MFLPDTIASFRKGTSTLWRAMCSATESWLGRTVRVQPAGDFPHIHAPGIQSTSHPRLYIRLNTAARETFSKLRPPGSDMVATLFSLPTSASRTFFSGLAPAPSSSRQLERSHHANPIRFACLWFTMLLALPAGPISEVVIGEPPSSSGQS